MSAEMTLALKQLGQSLRGIAAIETLLEWLDDDGIGLDEANQVAVIVMLQCAWKNPGRGRDMMREAIK